MHGLSLSYQLRMLAACPQPGEGPSASGTGHGFKVNCSFQRGVWDRFFPCGRRGFYPEAQTQWIKHPLCFPATLRGNSEKEP